MRRWWRRRCRALPPQRLADADVCRLPRRHGGWHEDGQGYSWDDVAGRWAWRGPVVDLADLHEPGGGDAVFREERS